MRNLAFCDFLIGVEIGVGNSVMDARFDEHFLRGVRDLAFCDLLMMCMLALETRLCTQDSKKILFAVWRILYLVIFKRCGCCCWKSGYVHKINQNYVCEIEESGILLIFKSRGCRYWKPGYGYNT